MLHDSGRESPHTQRSEAARQAIEEEKACEQKRVKAKLKREEAARVQKQARAECNKRRRTRYQRQPKLDDVSNGNKSDQDSLKRAQMRLLEGVNYKQLGMFNACVDTLRRETTKAREPNPETKKICEQLEIFRKEFASRDAATAKQLQLLQAKLAKQAAVRPPADEDQPVPKQWHPQTQMVLMQPPHPQQTRMYTGPSPSKAQMVMIPAPQQETTVLTGESRRIMPRPTAMQSQPVTMQQQRRVLLMPATAPQPQHFLPNPQPHQQFMLCTGQPQTQSQYVVMQVPTYAAAVPTIQYIMQYPS